MLLPHPDFGVLRSSGKAVIRSHVLSIVNVSLENTSSAGRCLHTFINVSPWAITVLARKGDKM